jgi:hypothetical protein
MRRTLGPSPGTSVSQRWKIPLQWTSEGKPIPGSLPRNRIYIGIVCFSALKKNNKTLMQNHARRRLSDKNLSERIPPRLAMKRINYP